MLKALLILSLYFALLLAKNIVNDYHIDSIQDILQNGFKGTFAQASYKGKDDYYIKEGSTVAKTLNMTVLYESDSEFTVKITRGEAKPRFSMPHEFPFSYTKTTPEDYVDPEYAVEINKDPLSFKVQRSSTQETIFDTTAFDLIYSEYFLTFGTTLPTHYFYGMGERRTRGFMYKTGVYTIWCKDQFAMIDDGMGNQETYGAHPVYLMREESGNWHMVLLRTTNALDFYFNSTSKTLQYMVTGGEIELKFFLGNKYPDTVIKMYHDYLNKWTNMPFWSFGYHQCKWGYLFLSEMQEVVDKMRESKLPLDVIWSDIDYMDNFTDFTVDADRYDLGDFREMLKEVRWVPIVDAGVFINKDAPAYVKGTEYDVWIKSARNHSSYLVGVVWPGLVHWPDWLSPNASKYWGEMLTLLYSFVPFSGIWIDMDENSNFCQGEYPYKCFTLPNYLPRSGVLPFNLSENAINGVELNVTLPAILHPLNDTYKLIEDFNSTNLPYIPGNNTPLEDHGLSLNALHYGRILSFDFHNLDPFYESYYTYQGQLNLTGKRPFVLTRGNFFGVGQFAAHWTGDNAATWDFLQLSISELFDLQVFGIPMGGADICGFMGSTTVELCSRWMQLGAWYPFMRNHHQIGSVPQEPYALGPTVLETSRAALYLRYSLLKYYYSIFIRNNGTGTIFRPVFFDFPNDENILDLITQFLIGSEIMVAPAVYPGQEEVGVYFPCGDRWYDLHTGKMMIEADFPAVNVTIPAPFNTTSPAYLKGGSIIHRQNVENVRRTDDLDNKFKLVIALTPVSEDNSVAFGQMMGIKNYQDDASIDKCIGVNDCMVNIAVNADFNEKGENEVTLTFDPNTKDSILEEIFIDGLTFYGVRHKLCHFYDEDCGREDYVMECKYENPVKVEFGTTSFVLTQDGCTRK